MNENHEERHGGVLWFIFLLTGVFGLYALSSGPVVFILETAGVPENGRAWKVFYVIYAPLGFTAYLSGMIDLLRSYLDWWGAFVP